MEKYGDGQKKMEGHCSTGQSSHRAVVPVEEEDNKLKFYKESHSEHRLQCRLFGTFSKIIMKYMSP
jgi:hypothetical protein